MPIFLLFVRAGVLFDGAFSVQVSLNALILFCQFFIHKIKSRFQSIFSYDRRVDAYIVFTVLRVVPSSQKVKILWGVMRLRKIIW